jgi:nucleotidyltransferase substrate binding protein (TIGR01987 family)
LENFGRALSQLEKALAEVDTPIVRDATIQRFEFTYKLCWKTLKGFLEDVHGVRAVSPRQVFKESFALDLIDDEEIFLEMIESRNILSHTYNEEQAREIYLKCSKYLNALKIVINRLTNE